MDFGIPSLIHFLLVLLLTSAVVVATPLQVLCLAHMVTSEYCSVRLCLNLCHDMPSSLWTVLMSARASPLSLLITISKGSIPVYMAIRCT